MNNLKKFSYPDEYPKDFETAILPKGLVFKRRHVYRLCKWGKIDKEAFFSTFQEVYFGLRKPSRKDITDSPDYYSTSCHEEYRDSIYTKRMLGKYNPEIVIARGYIEEDYGLSQLTSERDSNKKDSHVDWWIYKGSNPCDTFHKIEEKS